MQVKPGFWIVIYYLLAIAVAVVILNIVLFAWRAFAAEDHGRTPLPPQSKVVDNFQATVTYYNSLPGQTSGNPNITADGTWTHFGVVAANCYAFGTKIRIPALFGQQVFEVHDRGGFGCDHVDVWLPVGERLETTRTSVELLR